MPTKRVAAALTILCPLLRGAPIIKPERGWPGLPGVKHPFSLGMVPGAWCLRRDADR
jgi:hypothetical protein